MERSIKTNNYSKGKNGWRKHKQIITLKEKMVEESTSQELELKNIYETRYYFIEKIVQNDLMSRKRKKK